jgi:hypothetical protein
MRVSCCEQVEALGKSVKAFITRLFSRSQKQPLLLLEWQMDVDTLAAIRYFRRTQWDLFDLTEEEMEFVDFVDPHATKPLKHVTNIHDLTTRPVRVRKGERSS